MKATPEIVTMAMQMYFGEMSFQMTANALKLKGVKISNVRVYKWVKKYARLTKDVFKLGGTLATNFLIIELGLPCCLLSRPEVLPIKQDQKENLNHVSGLIVKPPNDCLH